MLFARVILAGISAALIGLNVWIWRQSVMHTENMNGLCYLIWALSAIPFVAALTVLVFTFVRMERRGNQYVIPHDSRFIKWVMFTWDKEAKQNLNICKLFWATVLAIVLVIFVLMFISMVGAGLVTGILKNTESRLAVLGIVSIAGLVGGFGYGLGSEKQNRWTKFLRYFCGSLLGLCLVAVVGAAVYAVATYSPVDSTQFKRDLPKALTGFGITLASCAGILVLVSLAFRLVKVLRNTLIGRILATIKSGTCPVIKVVGDEPPADPAPAAVSDPDRPGPF